MKDYHYLILVFCLLTVLIGVLYKYPDIIWKLITVFVPDSWPVQPVSLSSTEADETYKVDAVLPGWIVPIRSGNGLNTDVSMGQSIQNPRIMILIAGQIQTVRRLKLSCH